MAEIAPMATYLWQCRDGRTADFPRRYRLETVYRNDDSTIGVVSIGAPII
jgi:hypothetical protein